jgi:uncharacterized protein YunC (DUF1805 family)
MRNVELDVNGKKGIGIEISLPKAPLVLAHGKNGFVMCGYLNIEAADRLNVAAAIVKGVSTVDDLLAGKVSAVSKAAAGKGVSIGMTGREALARFA